jgi:hypothetical protein
MWRVGRTPVCGRVTRHPEVGCLGPSCRLTNTQTADVSAPEPRPAVELPILRNIAPRACLIEIRHFPNRGKQSTWPRFFDFDAAASGGVRRREKTAALTAGLQKGHRKARLPYLTLA